MPKSTKDFDPLWVYRRLIADYENSSRRELVPELTPLRSEDWDDGWRGCWRAVVNEFLPHAEAFAPIHYDPTRSRHRIGLHDYEPRNEKEWQRAVDDDKMPKTQGLPVWENAENAGGNLHYLFLNDVYGWAVKQCLEYCRYRMHWGDWAVTDSGFDKSDTYFLNRPRSQAACRILVRWLERFAAARRAYHRYLYSGVLEKKASTGRPKKLSLSKTADEDCWLILIWPIAEQFGWNYKDVVRAVRLHFHRDRFKRPAPAPTLRAPEPTRLELAEKLAEWELEALRVSSADAEAIRLRCKRMGLPKLKRIGNDRESEPRLFKLVTRYYSESEGLAMI